MRYEMLFMKPQQGNLDTVLTPKLIAVRGGVCEDRPEPLLIC